MSHKTDATLRPFLFAFSHCVPSGRLPRHYAPRNDIKCVARDSIKSVFISRHHCLQTNSYSFPYEVLCHCERSVAISRKGILVIIPRKILLYLRGEKAQTAYYFVFIIYNYFYYYISKKFFENACFLLYKTFFIWYYPFITLYYAKLLTR